MNTIISLPLFLFFILVGYYFSNRAGWPVLIIACLLGPTALTLVGGSLLPLTIYRIAFAITIGITLVNLKVGLRTTIFKRSIFIKSLFLFVIIIAILSIPDRSKNIFFSFLPIHYFAIMMPIFIIKDLRSVRKLLVSFAWLSAIIGFSPILEFFTPYDLSAIIERSIPGMDILDIGVRGKDSLDPMMRGGFFRPRGLWGNSVITGYALSFLFPITLWYAISKRTNQLIKYFPMVLSIGGILILQSRAVFVAILFSLLILLFLFFKTLRFPQINFSFIKIILYFISGLIIILIINPEIVSFLKTYFNYLILSSQIGSGANELGLGGKIDRIPMALSFFYESPLWGQLVSPYYVAVTLMKGMDINSPLTYMISGGLFLASLHLFVIFYMPYKTMKYFNYFSNSSIDQEYKLILLYSFVAFCSGIIVIFFKSD